MTHLKNSSRTSQRPISPERLQAIIARTPAKPVEVIYRDGSHGWLHQMDADFAVLRYGAVIVTPEPEPLDDAARCENLDRTEQNYPFMN